MANDLSQSNLWLNIDKPIGYSSAKVVAIIKRITGAKKVGHGGTLDPFANGVLPVALNKATKTSESWMSAKKKYLFRISFGEFRETDDVEGSVEAASDLRPNQNQLISVLANFIGKIKQRPSRFSAIKINGQRAYDLARKNVDFVINEREVEIYKIALINLEKDFCDIEVECSKGTYVRSLCRDICVKLGVCGYVSKLERLEVGNFKCHSRISLDQLKLKITYGGRFADGALIHV